VPPHDAFNPRGPSDIAVIHHYHTKSLEEYRARCKRGLALYPPEAWKNQTACIQNETELLKHLLPGSVFDDSAWQVLKKNMPVYAMYDINASKDE
jgi:acetone carboxylase gamma subunit